MANTYWQKLKDPRWQKKRLEALSAKEFTCEICGDSSSQLHVHHKEYFKDLEPWEYELGQLSVLCDSCHENEHIAMDILKFVCSYAPLDGPANRIELAFLLAGYGNFMLYEDLIEFSCLKHHSSYKAYYDVGVLASRSSYDLVTQYYNEEKVSK